MKMNNYLLWIWVVLPLTGIAQVKQSQNWVGGLSEYPGVMGYGNVVVHFNGAQVTTDTMPWGIPFESTVAVISDSTGNLLLFTNGCALYNASGQVIQNGEDLNPGPIHDSHCGEIGYIVPKGAMILPIPGRKDAYWLLHLGARYDFERLLHYGPFYATQIEWLNGEWQVTSKNIPLLSGNIESFSVVRHGNGRDWWVVLPNLDNSSIEILRISPEGITPAGTYEHGFVFSGKRPGCSTFSPDGQKFARFHCEKGVLLADFDRCTGNFSNSLLLSPPKPMIRGGGVAFSEDGNTLFVMAQSQCYKIDLQTGDVVWNTLIDLYNESSWGTTLGTAEYAPNGNIYISPISRSKYLNALVRQDDGQYLFDFQSVALPVYQVRSVPHYPNFGLYDVPGSVCDSLGINAPVNANHTSAGPVVKLDVYPNPADDRVVAQWSGVTAVSWRIIDANGRVLLGENLRVPNANPLHIATNQLDAGSYFFQLTTHNGSSISSRLIIR
jgi:hypothetical protein